MSERTHLLSETLKVLEASGKTSADVRWVGSHAGGSATDWAHFAVLADVVYDSGYGGHEVASDLVVVGDGWWLERGEYDGAEWWDFKTAPVRLPTTRLPACLLADCLETP